MTELEKLRDTTIKRLEYNYSHGKISIDELERRLESAVHADTPEDLFRLSEGLSEIPFSDAKAFEAEESDSRKDEETIFGVLGGVKRKGRWTPARTNKILVFMGGVDLDFSEAELGSGITEFEFFCAMGGIDLKVPEGINVDLSGLPIMGGIENKLSNKTIPGNPTLKIHGMVVMGGVDVKPA